MLIQLVFGDFTKYMLSIFFPLLLSIILYRLNPIKLEDYYESKELWQCDVDASASKQVPWKFFWLLLIVFIPTHLVIAIFQSYLFELDQALNSEIIFITRANDTFTYPLMIGMFFGIITSSIVLSHIALRQGPKYVKEVLLLKWNTTYIYNSIKLYKPTTIALGIGLTVMNYWTSNIFIEINETGIKYSTWLMPFSESRPVSDIKCINQYERRIVPSGAEYAYPTIEIIFDDNTALDTYNFIYNDSRHFDGVKTAVQHVINLEIPVYHRNTVMRNGMVGSCG